MAVRGGRAGAAGLPAIAGFLTVAAVLFWLVAGVLPAIAGPSPLVVTGEKARFSLAGYLSAFHDPAGTMDLAAVEAAAAAGQFQPLPGGFNAGIESNGAWWLRFEISAGAGGDGLWWLSVDAHPLTSDVDAWVPVAGRDGRIAPAWQHSGAEVPPERREMPVALFVFRMDVPQDGTQAVYVRLSGTRTLRAMMNVWRMPALVGHVTAVNTVLSLMLGAAAFLAGGAILVGIWLRERMLILLGAHTTAMTALQVVINGVAVPSIIWLASPVLHVIHGVLLYLTAATMCLCILAVFRGLRDQPLVRRFMLGYLAFTAIGAAGVIFGGYTVLLPVLLVLSIAFCLLTIVAAFRWMRAGEPAGSWFFLAATVYNIALMAYASRILGLLPLTMLSLWVFPALVVAQIAVLCVGISVAIRARIEKQRALERQVLAAARSNEQRLEDAVAERTRALREENEARGHAEAALRRALREQRNLLAMVSHEFRTPLATIGAAVHVVHQQGVQPGSERELVKIGRAVGRLGGLIDTFLAEEWVDRAALQLRLRETDIAVLAGELARDTAAEEGREITVAGPSPLRALVDPALVRVAVGNLVSNALKYSEGPVRIAFSVDNGILEIRVSDTGPGVAADEREAVFERYYRCPANAALPGAGLGLFIVRRVAELHGGSVRVETAANGTGAVFVMSLPDHGCASEAETWPAAAGSRGGME